MFYDRQTTDWTTNLLATSSRSWVNSGGRERHADGVVIVLKVMRVQGPVLARRSRRWVHNL